MCYAVPHYAVISTLSSPLPPSYSSLTDTDTNTGTHLSYLRYEARETLRWYSSWVLIIACIPVLAMYSLWMYHTIAGHIEPISDEGHAIRRNEQHQDTVRTDGDNSNDDGIYNLKPVRCDDPPSISARKHTSDQSNLEEGQQRSSEPVGVGIVTGAGRGLGESGRKQSHASMHTTYHMVAQALHPSKSAIGGSGSSGDYTVDGDDLNYIDNPLSSSLLPPTSHDLSPTERSNSYVAPKVTTSAHNTPPTGPEEELELNMNEFEVMEL